MGSAPPFTAFPVTSTCDWDGFEDVCRAVKEAEFGLRPGTIFFNTMVVASPPKIVRDAIKAHREALDADPVGHVQTNGRAIERTIHVANRAAKYLGLDDYLNTRQLGGTSVIAQTNSTTAGLALLANGLAAKPGQDVLISTHDFFSWRQSWQLRCDRSALRYREISLYADPRRPGREISESSGAIGKERVWASWCFVRA